MTELDAPDERIVSAASIEGLLLELPVSRAALAAYLGRFGPLKVGRASGADGVRPCVSLEVWTVTDGRLVIAGADQHDSVARWAKVGAGVFGAAWGASLAWMATSASGNFRRAPASMSQGAQKGYEVLTKLAGTQARTLSRAFTLGPYHELLVGVPNVSLAGAPGRHTLVIGMVTDDAMARSIDRWFGYGYHKQPGTFALGGDGSVRVDTGTNSSLSIEIEGTGRVSLGPRSAGRSFLNRRWDLPLLGGLHDGRWTRSRLQRRVTASGGASQVLGKVEIRGDLFGAPLSGRHVLGRASTDGARAVFFEGVSARISPPEPASRRGRG
jgi:hypothetical protein